MDPKIIDFVVQGLQKEMPPEAIIQGMMENFRMDQKTATEMLGAIVEELQAGQAGPKEAQQQAQQDPRQQRPEQRQEETPPEQKGKSDASDVIAVFDKLGVEPKDALSLVKAIFELNQQGIKELVTVLAQAFKDSEEPPKQKDQEDPMNNI